MTVDGTVVKAADRPTDPESEAVAVEGKTICYRKHLYIMMNKPQGYVSASHDEKEKTVLELLPEDMRRSGLFPAGRLDKDTEGLLIITDDGEFAHRMTAPGKGVYKTYIARLDGQPDEQTVKRFGEGITLGDGEGCLPAKLTVLEDCCAAVEICEGKYHQVKRMFAACGLHVCALKRIKIGALALDERLSAGECRLLNKDEIDNLLKNQYDT